VEAESFDSPSTRQAAEALAGFGEGRALVVLAEGEENAAKSFRNISGVTVLRADDVGVADVIGAARLVASAAAFERLTALASAPLRAGKAA
jgi:large subunit ribosomal protein L4